MALADALLVVARLWPEFRDRLSPKEIGFARRQLAAAVHGATWDPAALVETLLAHERADHPAWDALASSTERRTSAEAVAAVTAATALRLVIEAAAEDPVGDADAVERAAERRLLIVPMLPLDAAAATDGADILLVPHHGRLAAPRFQFDAEGDVLPPVAAVNRTLDAADDPWGVASWWLTPHNSLRAIPSDAVRTESATDVMAAATAARDLR